MWLWLTDHAFMNGCVCVCVHACACIHAYMYVGVILECIRNVYTGLSPLRTVGYVTAALNSTELAFPIAYTTYKSVL